MNRTYKISILLLLLVFVTIPTHVKGQNQSDANVESPNQPETQQDTEGVVLLEQSLPGIGVDGKVPTGGLNQYLEGMFFLGIGIAAVLAVVVLTIGGVQYMLSESLGGKEGAKEKISAAIWGFVLALAAFLILRTINPDLLRFGITDAIETLQEYDAKLDRDRAKAIEEGLEDEADWPDDQSEYELLKSMTRGSRGEQRAFVRSTGRDPEGGDYLSCRKVKQQECTSLWGISRKALDGVVRIIRESGCPVEINGGTEYWLHGNRSRDVNSSGTNHKPANKGGNALDINNGCVDQYIIGDNDVSTANLYCKQPFEKSFATFYWEDSSCPKSTGAHWHVEFN